MRTEYVHPCPMLIGGIVPLTWMGCAQRNDL
jgi:hypothetical protein